MRTAQINGTTIAFERLQVSALLRQAREDRDSLRASLHRVDDDPGYGVCEVCFMTRTASGACGCD